MLEGNGVKLKVDLSIPTDRRITARRPDLIALFSEPKRILVMEVACSWDSGGGTGPVGPLFTAKH